MSRVTLQNLQVFRAVAPGKHIQLDDRHNRREIQAIRNIIDRSLLIYETPRGRAALAHHAQRVVIGLNGASLYPANDPTFARMPLYIDSFLRSLRSDFPQVYIENDGDEDAAFARTAWAPTAPGTTLDSCVFVASRSGKMYMCLDIVDQMFKSQNNDHILLWQFHMVITIFHELGHCLTGYLSGNPRADTPAQVGVAGYFPEAGYALEQPVFGGTLDMWAVYSRSITQPGVPYLFRDFDENTKGQRVSMAYIKRFMEGTSGIPLPIEVDPTDTPRTARELQALGYTTMTQIRGKATPMPSRPSSSGSGSTVSTLILSHPQSTSAPPPNLRPRSGRPLDTMNNAGHAIAASKLQATANWVASHPQQPQHSVATPKTQHHPPAPQQGLSQATRRVQNPLPTPPPLTAQSRAASQARGKTPPAGSSADRRTVQKRCAGCTASGGKPHLHVVPA